MSKAVDKTAQRIGKFLVGAVCVTTGILLLRDFETAEGSALNDGDFAVFSGFFAKRDAGVLKRALLLSRHFGQNFLRLVPEMHSLPIASLRPAIPDDQD